MTAMTANGVNARGEYGSAYAHTVSEVRQSTGAFSRAAAPS